MAIGYSKLDELGQTIVPTEICQKLGIGPGSVLEWDEEGGKIVVRRAGLYSSEDVRQALFEKTPAPRTLEQLKEGVQQSTWDRHARR